MSDRYKFNESFSRRITRLLNETDSDIQISWFTIHFVELFRHGSASDRDLFLTNLLEVFADSKTVRLLCLAMANTLACSNRENFKRS